MAVVLLGLTGLALLIAVLIGSGLVSLIATRRIGGQTGDVLGAAQVIAETCCWLCLSAMLA